ncbi:MAG: hypothetical protein DIJKHBIC_03100 [Thermoanaerobaculia bacterium]|nr:hypothetical protein [Thermoanaerobaculia bacterium]
MQTPPRPIPECYWVVPGLLLAGEYPGAVDVEHARRKIASILDARIRFFIDLTREGELDPYSDLVDEEAKRRGIAATHLRQPVRDLSVPKPSQMAAILDQIDANLKAGVGTYYHCWGGVGRTGTVSGCYFVRHGLSGEAALLRVAELWKTVPKHFRAPESPETEEQRAFVLGWKEPEK